MKTVLICAGLLATPIAANAQTAPATAAPAAPAASATPAATGALNGDTPIEAIMADPTGKDALTKQFPDIPGHAAYDQFKGMSLRQLAPLAGGIITDEKIAAFETQIKTK